MRSVFAMTVVATLVAANSVAAQTTSAPPAAAPAPSAPATGAPALAPTPGTPSPGGVTQMPSPSINSTPSQSNVELYPPTRVLPNPAPSAGTPSTPSPGQIPPSGVSQGRAPSGAAQKGGPNDRNPVGTDTGEWYEVVEPGDARQQTRVGGSLREKSGGTPKTEAVRERSVATGMAPV
jgi:hypothetical protein